MLAFLFFSGFSASVILFQTKCYCHFIYFNDKSCHFGCSVSLNFVLTLLRVLGAPHGNITNTYCHSQQVFYSGWCVVKHHQCLRAEVIYEASLSYQGGRPCLQKALRMTLWECEQIHQSGLSLRPKVLSRGWPSLQFHHWDMEHNCECVLKDKRLYARRVMKWVCVQVCLTCGYV